MGLLHRKRRKRGKRYRPRPRWVPIGCAFCWEWIEEPRPQRNVFSGEGCLGGRCACSAAYVLDETGRDGGQALLDAQALACDGDLERAMELRDKVDFEVKTRDLGKREGRTPGRAVVSGYLPPKVWFLKLTG